MFKKHKYKFIILLVLVLGGAAAFYYVKKKENQEATKKTEATKAEQPKEPAVIPKPKAEPLSETPKKASIPSKGEQQLSKAKS